MVSPEIREGCSSEQVCPGAPFLRSTIFSPPQSKSDPDGSLFDYFIEICPLSRPGTLRCCGICLFGVYELRPFTKSQFLLFLAQLQCHETLHHFSGIITRAGVFKSVISLLRAFSILPKREYYIPWIIITCFYKPIDHVPHVIYTLGVP